MKSLKEYMTNEDSVDMEKHNSLNDIFQALERLNTEIDELDALDSDMDSTGVGDLTRRAFMGAGGRGDALGHVGRRSAGK